MHADCNSPAVQLHSKETATPVKTADKCITPRNECDNDEKLSACISIPRVEKMSHNTNEVMAWMEDKTDCEHLIHYMLFQLSGVHIK